MCYLRRYACDFGFFTLSELPELLDAEVPVFLAVLVLEEAVPFALLGGIFNVDSGTKVFSAAD